MPFHVAGSAAPLTAVLADGQLRLDADPVDYALVALYFVFVLGIGLLARQRVSSSIDFFLSGRSLPAWVTGLAFISANLGAVEIMGMSANGAEYGMPTMHYFWIGAVPAMLFLGVVMMPFYYGSKVRSVPEFMRRRFGPGAHLVNALSFAVAQVLIAGVNLYLLGTILNVLLGWPLWVSVMAAAVIVLSYITLGGLSAAIYNEVLQFFVIVAALLPLTLVGLHKVGGWDGLRDKVIAGPGGAQQVEAWPGNELSGFANNFMSILGIVFGLGFVLSFGYWTTNFVEVQRAMATHSISAARRTPIIGAYPKMFIPFLVVIPGMISAVLVPQIIDLKAQTAANPDYQGDTTYNQALLYLMKDTLPNGLLGVGLAGLLAAFMAGMAANVSAFNTVFSYDLWQQYVVKDREDGYYLRVGRLATVGATVAAIGTAFIAGNFGNMMDYLQTLFSFFNAPLFATFILGMFWKRMTPAAGWAGLVAGTASAIVVFILHEAGVFHLSGQGSSFVAAGVAFAVDIVVSVVVTQVSQPRPAAELVGLVYSETPKEVRTDPESDTLPWYQRPVLLAGIALVIVIALNIFVG
ncbi:sodium:solute symporter family protein [Nocardia otitidiscaviarum]|uniref:Sodium/solute symporter n=1 Tax=Nocardia otitidiscaviarum TaxID=1823 RepID=A0A516NGX8_9NOCA|nr:sodium:solute symporter family protein [Nocardia otitidiscaviarum]MBF6177794.1 sodium:solute symporter family protein [Nocardia otitidiscaviarum]MCP9623476.1 sodium:solute symporter family protein [Nocardia otitidiscaviarum]QDP78158.1 sodium/solute symporter [Nocardia otitidiscaviarum]